jgi:hypothetical protein
MQYFYFLAVSHSAMNLLRLVSSVGLSSRSTATNSLCSIQHLLINQHVKRNSLSTSTKSEPQTSSSSLENEASPGQDDTKYFKQLGKTTNHYWTNNAEQVVGRLNMERLIDPDYNVGLRKNLRRRHCDDKVDLDKIRSAWGRWKSSPINSEERQEMAKILVGLALWVPNDSHPAALRVDGDVPITIKVHGQPPTTHDETEVLEFQKYCDKHNWLKNDNLGNIANHRSYFLKVIYLAIYYITSTDNSLINVFYQIIMYRVL